MTNKSRVKTLIIFLFLTIFSFTLYLTSQRTKWDSGWDKGLLSISERNYYSNRFTRIIKYWQQTAHEVYDYNKDQFPESYHTYLIIDLEKKALWIEENGQIRTENYIELSPEAKWSLYHNTPNGHTELSERTAIKIRGLAGNLLTPERFYLLGEGVKGYLLAEFSSYYENSYYNSGSFVMRSVNFQTPTVSADKIYPSIIATDEEYKQYLNTLSDSKTVAVENENIKAWNKIEKYLYMEIERQFPKKGYKFESVSIEPGPDYSAARAQINVRKEKYIDRIRGHRNSIQIYQNIDYLGDDIWYVKSVPNPYSESKTKIDQPLELEFIISPNGVIKGSKHTYLLKKGREFQNAALIPESKWKKTLSNGTTIELIGLCDNPSIGKQWWGPDGSLLKFVPYYHNEVFDKIIADTNIFEMVWRLSPPAVTNVSLDGSRFDYHYHGYRPTDRYGYSIPSNVDIKGIAFDNSREVTTLKASLSITDWKVPLQIRNKTGEINFRNKKRFILNPPEIINEQLIVKCYEESQVKLTEYKTDFAIIVNNGFESKTVPLAHFERQWPHKVEESMDVHAYIIKDYKIDQIEGVCFRYQPYSYVIFKNISLVPGEDFGVEIEVIEAEE